MSKIFDKFGGMRVEVLWADLKPLIDGTTAKFPFLDGVDEGGNTTVAAFDGNTGYFATLTNPIEESEFTTAKGTAIAYFQQTPTVIPDGTDFRQGVDSKISQEIPAGTKEIGAVKQGTKAAGAGAWPTALYDASGNPVAIILDNAIYRLESRSKIAGQVQGVGAEVNVTTIVDTAEDSEYRLQTEARLAPGSQVNIGTGIPSDPASLVIDFLKNGGSHNLLVDGTTPVAFTYTPGAGVILSIQSLLVVFTADDFSFDGVSFGPTALLANGIKFETNIGGITTEIFNIRQNEDFLRVPGRIPLVNNTGPKDVLGVAFEFGGLVKLSEAAGDQLIVTVRDDLTGVKLKYLTATIYGAEV